MKDKTRQYKRAKAKSSFVLLKTARQKIALSLFVVLMTVFLPVATFASYPDNVQSDYFGRNTSNSSRSKAAHAVTSVPIQKIDAGPHPVVSVSSTPVQWFEAFDDYVCYYRPTQEERVKISLPFNQELERVNEFCQILARLSKRYKMLAYKIQAMPIPKSMPEINEFRDLNARWYSDGASLYDDMIRPRRPARTKEELEAMLKDVEDRSQGLAQANETLQTMDSEIRRKYNVHSPKADDALRQFYERRPGQ